jgi:hypothetical protein
MEQLNLPADGKLAGKIVDNHVRNEQAKLDRGWIGNLIGSANSVPSNIAGVIAVVGSLALILSIVCWSGSNDFTRKDGVAALSSLITLVIGYLFGKVAKD